MATNNRGVGQTRCEQLRRHYARTQEQLSADASVPRTLIVAIEGGYLPPRSAAAERLARHFGCSVPELVERPAPSERLFVANRAPASVDPWGQAQRQRAQEREAVTA